MFQINAHVVPYLFILFELCFVNNQNTDGVIELKQGNIIGVRNINFCFEYFMFGSRKMLMGNCFIS